MIDAATRRPLRVETSPDAGAFIMIRLDQLAAVRPVLDRNSIRYWVDEEAISIDGRPAVTFINLGRGEVPEVVQGLLDALD